MACPDRWQPQAPGRARTCLRSPAPAHPPCLLLQAAFSVVIFVLLSSEDGFKTKWSKDEHGVLRAPAIYNGAFSTIAFIIGAATSILSGYLGMTIATYANARTALEARKGIAPAFMVGEWWRSATQHLSTSGRRP